MLLIKFINRFPPNLLVRSWVVLFISLPFICTKYIKRNYFTRTKPPLIKQSVNRVLDSNCQSNLTGSTVCVRFSGGYDSTLCAAAMAENFSNVTLLTYDVSLIKKFAGIIQSHPKNAEINYRRLCNRFGQSIFTHRILDLPLREHIYFNFYLPMIPRNNTLAVNLCPACTMAMHIETIRYCRKYNISFVSDGSHCKSGQFLYQMQHPANLAAVTAFYRRFGINYIINPHYSVPDSADLLQQSGILSAGEIDRRYLTKRYKEQYCVPIQYYSLCRHLSRNSSFIELPMINFIERVTNYCTEQFWDSIRSELISNPADIKNYQNNVETSV